MDQKNQPVYPPCKECGASHGMGIENMESGVIEPIDICYDCLWNLKSHKVVADDPAQQLIADQMTTMLRCMIEKYCDKSENIIE